MRLSSSKRSINSKSIVIRREPASERRKTTAKGAYVVPIDEATKLRVLGVHSDGQLSLEVVEHKDPDHVGERFEKQDGLGSKKSDFEKVRGAA